MTYYGLGRPRSEAVVRALTAANKQKWEADCERSHHHKGKAAQGFREIDWTTRAKTKAEVMMSGCPPLKENLPPPAPAPGGPDCDAVTQLCRDDSPSSPSLSPANCSVCKSGIMWVDQRWGGAVIVSLSIFTHDSLLQPRLCTICSLRFFFFFLSTCRQSRRMRPTRGRSATLHPQPTPHCFGHRWWYQEMCLPDTAEQHYGCNN